MSFRAIRAFLKLETTGGVILCLTALCAIILANSPYSGYYEAMQALSVEFDVGPWHVKTGLLSGVNEGLMTLFFLNVGLELKREFLTGSFREMKQILLPGMAALGGMIVPALIYTAINWSDPAALKGWAIPVATDIAFALAVLSLLGKRVPLGLKFFLMALAIFDDLGAIIIIAFFNTQTLSLLFLALAGLIVLVLGLLNRLKVFILFPYLLLGFFLWLCLSKSGVHPTIAGVILALFIPNASRASPLQRLKEGLHGMVACFVMPLFAFMNAGLSFREIKSVEVFDSMTLGIIAGLFFGKQLGVFGFSFAMIKSRLVSLPEKTSWLELYGVAILCGIGFTMSLFLGTLAYTNGFSATLTQVRLGVLTGSVLSGIVGAAMLLVAFRKTGNR